MFFDRLSELCIAKGVSAYKACTDIGLNRAAVAKWKTGSQPNSVTVAKLADYFNVSVDFLLGKNENTPTLAEKDERNISNDDLKFALWGTCENVTDEDLDDVRRYAAFLRERKQK